MLSAIGELLKRLTAEKFSGCFWQGSSMADGVICVHQAMCRGSCAQPLGMC